MRGKAIGIMTLLVVLIASTSFAASCPTVTEIGALHGGNKFTPQRIAVDATGNTYVTDARNDAVNMYNVSGGLVKSIRVEYPLAVAVDASGKVYVGAGKKPEGNTLGGAVMVYDSNLNFLYRLGAGEGEFKFPSGVAADAGKVYVTDGHDHVVKVYNVADGAYVSQFGGFSKTTVLGKLVNPVDVEILPSGNLIVADKALIKAPSTSGGLGDTTLTDPNQCLTLPCAQGVKIHEFQADGTFVRKFGTYGFGDVAGTMSLIGGIAVDNAGRIYASENNKGVLHVFDAASGGALCIIQYDSGNGSFPKGIAATADGRLLVGASGRVVELGLDTYTKMVVSPSALSFSAQECGAQPATKTITVSNDGPGTLNFGIASDSAWLTPSLTTGNIAGPGSVDITVSVDKSGLAVGAHTGTLTVSGPGGEQAVAVTLEILAPPVLSVSPLSMSFSALGGNPPAQTLSIGLSGSGSWSASSDSAWLGISPSSGSSDLLGAQVSVDATGLAGGRYSGRISVSAACAANGPVDVLVDLDVVAGGTIQVTTNINDASYTISGPATYSGSGMSYTVGGAPTGVYTIQFGAVPGFVAPASQSLNVTNGSTVSFNGDYRDIRKRLDILAAPGAGVTADINDLNLYDGDGALLGSVALQKDGREFMHSSIPASGDVDGDGVEEIIVSHDMGVITGLRADGTPVSGLDFLPFGARTYVDVALADLDGDGRAEIIASPLNWSENGATVKVFSYSGGAVVDTGVSFQAYTGVDWAFSQENNRRGTRIAAGDVDGDGMAEVLTVQGGGYSKHNINVKIFDVEKSGGIWTISETAGPVVSDIYSYYSDVTTGDIDADGVDEIIISDATSLTAEAQNITVRALSAAGDKLLEFAVNSVRGVEVAAGDLNFDGKAEIVVGAGAFRPDGNSSQVRVFDANGILLRSFTAYDPSVLGVRVAIGQVVGN